MTRVRAPHIGFFDIAYIGARRKTILRQADAPVAQIGANLLVFHVIKAQFIERLREASHL